MSTLSFDYYYGEESEQFIFYRIPKLLFTDERFTELSLEAKVLYGVMLDRMGLSLKNKWLDEQKRVYIVFTIDKIMKFLHCREQKANKLLKDLEEIGLIERKRNGLGKPNFIYVKNFLGFRKNEYDGTKKTEEIEENTQKSDNFSVQKPPNDENLWQSQHQNNEKDNYRNAISATQDFSKSQSNHIISFSDTGFSNTEKINKTVSINNHQYNLSYPSYLSNIDKQLEQKTDEIEEIDTISYSDTEKEKPKQRFFIDKGLEQQMCKSSMQEIDNSYTECRGIALLEKQLEQKRKIDTMEQINTISDTEKEEEPKQRFFIDKGLEQQICKSSMQEIDNPYTECRGIALLEKQLEQKRKIDTMEQINTISDTEKKENQNKVFLWTKD